MPSFALPLLLLLTWAVNVFHLGTAPALSLDANQIDNRSRWLPKGEKGINQIILFGTPLERGNFFGQATKGILYQQESALQEQLKTLLPKAWKRQLLFFVTMRWFWGVEDYLEPWMKEEMWGVAQSTSHEFDFLAERYTRQIAYHGLHEVGQTMVDMNPEFAGCTVFAVPNKRSWVIGRNFDFEGGRIFDDEKIIKWVFPDRGNAYVSVIWAGMVGAVTGVNQYGVYISLNAAGTTDFRRVGTPSTLVMTKALQEAKTAVEARDIISAATMFITDIFVVADTNSAVLYRIEKSPKRTVVKEERNKLVVANHLVSREWEGDKINEFRKNKLTSAAREQRGEELLGKMQIQEGESAQILQFLRDKKSKGEVRLHLGNRSAIDALIATHAVVWDGVNSSLFVSRGPSLVGEFLGFDLKESFTKKTPIAISGLPADPEVSVSQFSNLHTKLALLAFAQKRLKSNELLATKSLLDKAQIEHVDYYELLGDYLIKIGDKDGAERAWEKAFHLLPAYANQKERLEKKLRLVKGSGNG